MLYGKTQHNALARARTRAARTVSEGTNREATARPPRPLRILSSLSTIFKTLFHSNEIIFCMVRLYSFFILWLFCDLVVFKTRQQTRLSAQKQFCSCVSTQRVIKLGLRQSALHLRSTRSLAIRKLNGPLRNVDP